MLAAAVGFVLVIGIIVLQVLLDNKINTEEDVTKYLDMTVLGVIPQYDQGGKRNRVKSVNIISCLWLAQMHRSSLQKLTSLCEPTWSSLPQPAIARLS